MLIFVVVDAKHGDLSRYRTNDQRNAPRRVWLTHSATFGKPVTFSAESIDEFRNRPLPQHAEQTPAGAYE